MPLSTNVELPLFPYYVNHINVYYLFYGLAVKQCGLVVSQNIAAQTAKWASCAR